jgi:hypothetical protein
MRLAALTAPRPGYRKTTVTTAGNPGTTLHCRPADPLGLATAVYDTDAVLAGGYVAGVASQYFTHGYFLNAGLSSNPSRIRCAPSGTHERSRFIGAVLNGPSMRCGRSIASSAFAGTNSTRNRFA